MNVKYSAASNQGLLLNVLRHSFPFINGIDIILPSVSNSSGLVKVGSVLALKGFSEDKMLSTYERSHQGLSYINYPYCSLVVGCVSLKTRGQEHFDPIKKAASCFSPYRVRFTSTPQGEVRIEGRGLLAGDLGQTQVTPGNQSPLCEFGRGAARRPNS